MHVQGSNFLGDESDLDDPLLCAIHEGIKLLLTKCVGLSDCFSFGLFLFLLLYKSTKQNGSITALVIAGFCAKQFLSLQPFGRPHLPQANKVYLICCNQIWSTIFATGECRSSLKPEIDRCCCSMHFKECT